MTERRIIIIITITIEFIWGQRADERLGDPPPKVDPGAFSGQRQG